MKNLTFISASMVSFALFAATYAEENLSPMETWAGLKAHPAVVNPVTRPADDPDTVSLKGEWEFRATGARTQRGCLGSVTGYKWDTGFWRHKAGGEGHGYYGEVRKINVPGCWEAQGVGDFGVTGTPCLIHWDVSPKPLRNHFYGDGWYRRKVMIPSTWSGRRIWLKTGWANSQSSFFVNGHKVALDAHYCGTYKYDVTSFVKPGEEAFVIAVVSTGNFPSHRGGLNSLHHFGGFLREPEFEATPKDCWIDDAWVEGDFDNRTAIVKVAMGFEKFEAFERFEKLRVTIDGSTKSSSISSFANAPQTPQTLQTSQTSQTFGIGLADFRPWSPESPNLYTAKVELVSADGKVLQTRYERFGVRKIEVRGREFYLNNRPFFFRGAGWHMIEPIVGCHYGDREYWRERVRKVRSAGFNFIRTHCQCWMPEYFEACDEFGLMAQPELPYYCDNPRDAQPFDPLGDAKELHEHFRRYPSFVACSGGNEGWFGDYLSKRMYRELKGRDPGRLVNQQDGWPNAEAYVAGQTDFSGGPMTVWPRGSFNPPMPFICHEYLNLCVKLDSRLADKFTGVWLPPTTRKARGDFLAQFGLDHDWGDRIQDGMHHMQKLWLKYGLESARLDPYCDGYSYWSLQDTCSPQKGAYSGQALFNPFWGEKPHGSTAADVAVYNSPSCVLLKDGDDVELYETEPRKKKGAFDMWADSIATNRVRMAGEKIKARFYFAHYENDDLKDAKLEWRVEMLRSCEVEMVEGGEELGKVLASGTIDIGDQKVGAVRKVAEVDITIPDITRPMKVNLIATITPSNPSNSSSSSNPSNPSNLSNSWPYWIFPRKSIAAARAAVEKAGWLIVDYGSEAEKAALVSGRNVISLANQTGKANCFLGWWWMGEQMGAAIRDCPWLEDLPQSGAFDQLFFRIGKTGLVLPVEGFSKDDFVMVGEGGEKCYLYLAERRLPNGAKHRLIAGLDVTADTPEGACLLEGASR